MGLLLSHPKRASRSCEDCRKFLFNEEEEISRRPANDPNGKPNRRPLNTSLPCAIGMDSKSDRCPKIPKSAPAISDLYAETLSERNRQALNHYLECEAVGREGYERRDWIVRRNARILSMIYREHDWADSFEAMAFMAKARGGK